MNGYTERAISVLRDMHATRGGTRAFIKDGPVANEILKCALAYLEAQDFADGAYDAPANLALHAASRFEPASERFRFRIGALGYTQRSFAARVGANERTVRRWAEGTQDIPQWVSVMLDLMERLAAAGRRFVD
jgi:hypothetical protein